MDNNNEAESSEAQSSVITGLTEITNNSCKICGVEGDAELLMTCLVCNVRKHSYCDPVPEDTDFDNWICELCPKPPVAEPAPIDPTIFLIARLSITMEYPSDDDISYEACSAGRRTPRRRSPSPDSSSGEDKASSHPKTKRRKLDLPGSSSKN